ncbi:hypothetical protein MAM1_0150c06626 [Mucor ambiguus]|uniref:Uncharacterized protein n=1 Tax=Mucor ambiguus TaxID=91626 RepID=A0A0C9MY44_9FUNG|nr:hypothetical protein MAM1_0150c06626 [Mucor ambiguus]
MALSIATNLSFEDENGGDAVDSKANDNGTASVVEVTVINTGHSKQEVTNAVALPSAAKYSKIWKHLRPVSSR